MGARPLPVFVPHPEAAARVASALTAVRALLATDLLSAHRRELISVCLWKLSEAEGRNKYDTRYVSAAALRQRHRRRAHDHVFGRAAVIDELLSGARDVESLPAAAVACTVLRAEHARLTRAARQTPHRGWALYEHLGIAVFDRLMNAWLLPP